MLQSKQQIINIKKNNLASKYKNKEPNVGIIESFKGYMTNLSYGFGGLSFPYFFPKNQNSQTNYKKQSSICILGEKMMSKQQAKLKHNELIWFTYKKKINLSPYIQSDIGWGCLIRVTQMLMAQALRRYFTIKDKTIEIDYIITSFLEEQSSDIKYNLKRFIAKGKQFWGLNAGQWFSMTQVTTILQSLHEKSPLKGSQYLKIKVFNETFDLKQLIKSFNQVVCSCSSKKIRCDYCKSCHSYKPHKFTKNTLSSSPYLKNFTKSVKLSSKQPTNEINILLIITTSFSNKNKHQQYMNLLSFMEMDIFSGCLGGIPKKARFLTGKNNNKISYLDPHYVQQAINRLNLIKNLQKFQSKQYRLMDPQQLDTDIGLSFYLKNLQDLQSLIIIIDNMKKQNKMQLIDYLWQDQKQRQFQLLGEGKGGKQLQRKKYCQLKQDFEELEESFSDLNYSYQDMNSSFLME